jgi:NAD(P)-dependent dehydrogenase (short-subunit alcohol dehydrogenase family)
MAGALMDPIRFDGRVAIVTGAGGGLGRNHALLLASRGAKVVVNDPGGAVDGRGGDNAVADKVVAEIRAAGGDAIASYDSVASWAGAQAIVDTAVKKYGKLDILVNNAGILRDKSFAKMAVEDFETVLNVHLMGTVYCTRAAWPLMMEAKYGRVVFTTSGSGLAGNFGQANYAAAKTGMIGLMNVLRLEGAKNGVKVNAVSPMADTRMTGAVGDPKLLQYTVSEHISPAVAWLCSEQCNVTGEILCAAGGYYTAVRFYRTEGAGFDPGKPATLDEFAAAASQIFDFSTTEPYTGVATKLRELLEKSNRI